MFGQRPEFQFHNARNTSRRVECGGKRLNLVPRPMKTQSAGGFRPRLHEREAEKSMDEAAWKDLQSHARRRIVIQSNPIHTVWSEVKTQSQIPSIFELFCVAYFDWPSSDEFAWQRWRIFASETSQANLPGEVMLRSGDGTVSVRSTVLEKDRWRIGRPCCKAEIMKMNHLKWTYSRKRERER